MLENILPLQLGHALDRLWKNKTVPIKLITEPSGMAAALVLSQTHYESFNLLPQLIIVENNEIAKNFADALAFFHPRARVFHLPGFDVSPYSGLSPHLPLIFERLRFLEAALQAKPGDYFVATLPGIRQNTLPFSVFAKLRSHLRKGSTIPTQVASWLNNLGYQSAPVVEDCGQFSMRGGILDIFSPAHEFPVRIELFGDQIESLRSFQPQTQKSIEEVLEIRVIPAREALFLENEYEEMMGRVRLDLETRKIPNFASEELLRSLWQKTFLPELEFLLPHFYSQLSSPIEYFSGPLGVHFLDLETLERSSEELSETWKLEQLSAKESLICPQAEKLFMPEAAVFKDADFFPGGSAVVHWSRLEVFSGSAEQKITLKASHLPELEKLAQSFASRSDRNWTEKLAEKMRSYLADDYQIMIAARGPTQSERLRIWLEQHDFHSDNIEIVTQRIPESLRWDEDRLVFLSDELFFGKKERRKAATAQEAFQSEARRLSFGDLKPGDLVVHALHGIGRYEGLQKMTVQGVDGEFIQLSYKDKDRLYLPVYRIGQLNKYSGPQSTIILNKLGGNIWEKTKIKVRAHLRDVALDLLKLYAERNLITRPPMTWVSDEMEKFEAAFAYEETEDQTRAIQDLQRDFESEKPMDRLICGDVGFGKTEVALRAAFVALKNGKQVAVLAPTTILTFQHFETFKKRLAAWGFEVRVLNRFVSTAEQKKTLRELKEGKVQLLIGTHRLLSKDVVFLDLGLLVVDEEQRFGVTHKERVRKMRSHVDTLTLSATPIPRTLNMSFSGLRDLSLINTAPVDRVPTRTFICRWEPETIRKAIESEIARGGQIYFIHNRVASIHGLCDEIRQLVPTARIRVAHGQMDEELLEKTMLEFFHHEIDILVCTAIVESGMDVSRANTMFIDKPELFGLSQLYQLRGRVGRSKQRAYCYLILPRNHKLDKLAEERLKVIQENTALGSGIKIAQYDLELRGTGNILGEEQSGHIDSVGYELYMDLLQEALAEAKGEAKREPEIDPEINLRIPALIPDIYIPDLRIRLSYYKALADIGGEDDLKRIEDQLRDQFGELPEPVVNLMGIMLIRRQCKDLGVKDLSAGPKNLSLQFTPQTKMKPETVIHLTARENKKYTLTPDQRLIVRMKEISWANVFEELQYLISLL